MTVMLVALLLVVVLSFAAFIRMEVRQVGDRQELFFARATARVGLHLAIADLQKHVGADKRITGTADLAGESAQSYWTGVWYSNENEGRDPVWLVSGDEDPTPNMSLQEGDFVRILPEDPDIPPSEELKVPLVSFERPSLDGSGTEHAGRFGWWVSDEGVKARVNIAPIDIAPPNTQDRMIRAQTPLEPSVTSLGEPWGDNNASSWENDEFRRRLFSRGTLDIAVSDVPAPTLMHDLTFHSLGLPVNVRDGGFKADWSVVLDRSMEGSALVERYLGASPGSSFDFHGATLFRFPEGQIENPDRFFLSERIGSTVSGGDPRPGPNLGTLWQYGRLWRDARNNEMNPVGLYPEVRADLRHENWLPYMSSDQGGYARDIQHKNSGVVPIISHLRFGMRLRTEDTGETDSDTGEPLYAVQLELKPLIGIWNPYTVGMAPQDYLFEWFVSPMVKIRVTTPASGDNQEYITWVRNLWSGTRHAGGQERWMQLNIDDIDFQAGEIRLFSVDTEVDQTGENVIDTIDLTDSWSEDGVIVTDFKAGNTSTALKIPASATLEVLDVSLQDTYHSETQSEFSFDEELAMSWISVKAGPSNHLYLSRMAGLWNGGLADETPGSGDFTVPEPFKASSSMPALSVSALASNPEHLATWAFHLRTTEQINAGQRTRGWVDADPRAPVHSGHWDGDRSFGDQSSFEGWYYTSTFTAEGNDHRGLAAWAGNGISEPQAETGADRYQGFLGNETTTGGTTHIPLFDVPTVPLTSVGQFQHAQLGRYPFEPAFVAGNSYANVRIPLDDIVSTNHNGIQDLDLYDTSYEVNQRIWDEIFFSTLAPDYVGGGSNWEQTLGDRLDNLPNPRMKFVPGQENLPLDTLLSSAGADGERGAEALASHIRIEGAFNINSTSKTAWKAVLSTLENTELPVVDPETRTLSWESPDGIRFNKFSHVLHASPYEGNQAGHAGFWRGWRQLSNQELDSLAEAIVEEVKARGPFRSMAEFVNRNPDSSTIAHRRKGALQAALDRTVNANINGGIDDDVSLEPNGSRYSNAFDDDRTSAGYAGYLLQGDLLQALAPILQARSDTFTIRCYGETGSPNTPASRVWCEAVVQRLPDYVDETDEPWRNPVDDTLSEVNLCFGRRFKVVAFRWIAPSESGVAPQ